MMTELFSSGRWFVLLGGTFSCIGLLHNSSGICRLDESLSRSLHRRLNSFLPLFRTLWLFGKTPVLLVLLLLMLVFDRQVGGWVFLVYLLIAAGERALKMALKRQRPFSRLPDVEMYQPRQPYDPSYPSGDAMRLWYLAFILPVFFTLPWIFFVIFCTIALLASLGRIAFGVHFFLDVVGGAGLGLIGVGLFKLCL
jgi:membrane-associated phospholipid phosphatase